VSPELFVSCSKNVLCFSFCVFFMCLHCMLELLAV